MDKEDSQVTILSEYFAPEEASTAQLMTELAVGLTDRFSMGALTSRPNYLSEDQDRRPPTIEKVNDVNIRRVRASRFDKDRLALRVFNWLTFTLLSTIRLLISRRRDDARLVLSNPPFLPIAPWIGKRIHGVPYVYVIYDIYPEVPIALDYVAPDGLVARLWHWLADSFYRDADRIVVLGESMDHHLRKRMADDPFFNPDKIRVIPNWEDPDFIQPMPKERNAFAREHDTVEPFTLVYSGNIGRFHELSTAIKAIGRLAKAGQNIRFLIIGEGAKKAELEELVQERDIDSVEFLPFQPKERLPETLTCGDASLVGIKSEMEGLCVSSKLYSSLAAGLPVLAVVGEGDEVARVVQECACGAWVEPGDVAGAADIIEEWIDNENRREQLGANARDCLVSHYARDHAIDAYADVIDEIVYN